MVEDALVKLIRSLNKSEKRHFKIHATKKNTKLNYLILFNEIDGSREFNEAKFTDKYKHYKFVKQLHVTKNYLKERLLISLREYHSEISNKARLHDLLRNVEILYEKELFQLCKKELDKAERLAMDYELNNMLLIVYQWKRKVIQGLEAFDKSGITDAVESEGAALNKVINTFNHKLKNIAIFNQSNDLKPFINQLTEVYGELSGSTEAYIFEAHSNYFSLIQQNRLDEAVLLMDELIDNMGQKKSVIEEEPGLYLTTVNNHLGLLVHLKKYEIALSQISVAKKLYETIGHNKRSRAVFRQIVRTSNIELEIYRDRLKTADNTQRLNEIEDFVLSNEEKIQSSYLQLFWYQFAAIKFGTNDNKGSLRYLNKLLQAPLTSMRSDIVVYSRILNLMVHYELNNMFIMGYYIDHTRRILKKNGLYQGWKKKAIKYFAQLRKTPRFEAGMVFKSMFAELIHANSSIKVQKEELDYLDLRYWIEKHC